MRELSGEETQAMILQSRVATSVFDSLVGWFEIFSSTGSGVYLIGSACGI
jgi:hypothetical protein